MFAVLSAGIANAQDFITQKNGDEIKAKVIEVTTNEVKYRLFDEPNGAVYTIDKASLLMIRYASGRNEVFNQQPAQKPLYGNSYGNTYEYSYGNAYIPVSQMPYRQLKQRYDRRLYVPQYNDPYSPFWCGFASFFICGLGECIEGEWLSGLGKFGGHLVLNSLGMSFALNDYPEVALPCYLLALALDIWSIIDASNIAKVKNMYAQDQRRNFSMELGLYPSVNCVQTSNGMQPAAGLTLALRF